MALKMVVVLFVLMIMAFTDRCVSHSRLYIPLEDELKAPLVVDLNVSKLNKALAKFINSEIQGRMKTSMELEMKRLVDEKAAALTTMLETKMNTLMNQGMQAVNKSISSELQNLHLVNLAAGRSAYQSSTHHVYYASMATNGNISDFTCTSWPNQERKPWLRIDLGHFYKVYKIRIFNRQDCCGGRLHDLNIKVGNTLGNMYLCGHFVGPGRNGEIIDMNCLTHPHARYVQIQIVKGVAEILVLGIK